MRFSSLSMITTAAFASHVFAQVCATTKSKPNPIAALYPDKVTGTLNGTIAILPIDLSLARSIIPSEYAILEKSYRKHLPYFPIGKYPALLMLQLDHDLGVFGFNFSLPDFQRASIAFPFVDRLGDGYTNMAYNLNILISESNPNAIKGAETYGNIVTPATFSPPCDAYASSSGCKSGMMYFNAFDPSISNSTPAFGSGFAPLGHLDHSPYALSFWKNITNQPLFSGTSSCDPFIRLFNTSNSLPPFQPTEVKGHVSIQPPFLPKEATFEGVYGLRLGNAFIEQLAPVDCETLKGYSGTGGLRTKGLGRRGHIF